MERTRKERVLTAADIMLAHSRLTEDLVQQMIGAEWQTAPFVAEQIAGAERLMRIMLEMLVENEVDE